MSNFPGVLCLIGWMCRNRGIREPYLNLHYYITYLTNCIYENLSISHIPKAAIVKVYPEFSFNSYSLAKGPHSSVNSESDP